MNREDQLPDAKLRATCRVRGRCSDATRKGPASCMSLLWGLELPRPVVSALPLTLLM